MFLFISNVYSKEYDENFDTSKNIVTKSLIEWKTSKNVQKDCEKESRKRGLNGFGYSLEACSFWNDENNVHNCTIITSKKTSMTTIGHEIRHCFQENFH